MKPTQQSQPPFIKQKLPYLQYNSNKKSHNQSLKKLLFNQSNQINTQHSSLHNIGLLPRIIKKPRAKQYEQKKNNQTSLQKNVVRWNGPGWSLKKRQKLHTQQHTIQQMTQIQQSFISLTNKIVHLEDDVKDTMFDFRKKIQHNKIIIKKQMQKKNKENHSSVNKNKSFLKKKRVNSSRLLENSPKNQQRNSKHTLQTPISKSKLEISIKQRSASKKKKKIQQRKRRQKTQIEHIQHQSEKSIPKRQSQGLFTDLQVMLDDKMRPQQEKTFKQQKKLRALLSKLSKFKNQKQYSTHLINDNPHSMSDHILLIQSSTDTLSPTNKLNLKRQTNYNQWNKIDLSSTSEISYRKSSFQQELRKVAEYTDRNDASLQKYLGMRKQLLKYGFQVQVGHYAQKNK